MSEKAFRVIPVLDVKNGQAVHAVGGIRSHYRPLQSILHPSSEPVAIARAYRDLLGFRDLYLADLDAISGRSPNRPLYRSLAGLGLNLWIDAGLKNEDDLDLLLEENVSTIVLGLETVRGPEVLSAMLDRIEGTRLVLSLDLFEGQALINDPTVWETTDPIRLGLSLVALGFRRLLILDLSRVGTRRGTGTSELLAAIGSVSPGIELAIGGGIAGIEDVIRHRAAGVFAVLIGSALHDATIGPRELAQIG
jgi:phosphoribosylformimino-5-aminoimidazole carboxamide ribotide isomerase